MSVLYTALTRAEKGNSTHRPSGVSADFRTDFGGVPAFLETPVPRVNPRNTARENLRLSMVLFGLMVFLSFLFIAGQKVAQSTVLTTPVRESAPVLLVAPDPVLPSSFHASLSPTQAALPENSLEETSVPTEVPKTVVPVSGVRQAAVEKPLVTVRDQKTTLAQNIGDAYAALMRGSYQTALSLYEKVLAEEAGHIQAMLGRATVLHKLRRTEEAKAAYEAVLTRNPRHKDALTNLLALIGEADPKAAESDLLALYKKAPRFSPVVAQLALLYAQEGQMKRAVHYLEEAVRLSPSSLPYRYNLAILLDRMGEKRDALRIYRYVLRDLPTAKVGAIPASKDEILARVSFLSDRGGR